MAQIKMVLALSLLLFFALAAESRTIEIDDSAAGNAKGEDAPTLVCNSVHGAEDGDTCFNVSQQFNLTSQEFNQLNPNVNCDTIFIGQWLCVDGSVSP